MLREYLNRVLFVSKCGVDVYEMDNLHNDSYEHFWCSTVDDVFEDSSCCDIIDDNSLVEYLNEGQCIETSDSFYLKLNDQLVCLSKKDLYKEAINTLVDGVDQILSVNDFIKMTPLQKARTEMVLTNVLFHAELIGTSIYLPIFSEFNYKKHPDYELDDVLSNLEFSTSSPLWMDAMSKIHSTDFQGIRPKLCYSYLCKEILMKSIL